MGRELEIVEKLKDCTFEDLEMLLDNIPYQVWIKGEDEKFKYVNKAFENMCGLTKNRIIGRKDCEYWDENLTEYFRKRDNEILKSKTAYLKEENLIINGEDKCFEIYLSPLAKDGDKSNYIMGLAKEITIDKNIIYEIGKNQSNVLNNKYVNSKCILNGDKGLKQIINDLTKRLEANGIAIFLYDKESNKLNLNLKSGSAELINDDYSMDLDEKIKQDLFAINVYNNARDIKESYAFQKWRECNNIDGNGHYGYLRMYAIKYEDELLGVLNIFYDEGNIPKYKQEDFIKFTCDKFGMIIKNTILTQNLQEELKRRIESENELESFLEIATDLWGVLGKDRYLKKASKNCVDTLGWTMDELTNLDVFNIIHPDDREKANRKIKFSMKKRKGEYSFIRVRCKSGEYKAFEWNWSCIEDGELVFLAAKDVTEQKKLEEEKKKLEETIMLENFKNEFFANISHEFRTPLNIILSTVQLISKDLEEKNCKNDMSKLLKYINGIKQNSYRLLRLVNNLIDITKIDGGYYNLYLENYNIVNVIEDVVLSVTEYMSEKERNIIFDTSEEEVILALDPDKIETIILNLLSNAIKYTDKNGTIQVSLNVNKEEKKIIVSVKDDGVGISDKNIETVFERFKQSENILTRRCEGSGIGLSLVKSLIEMHGGKIIAKNNVTKGAEFIFDIPIKVIQSTGNNRLTNKLLEAKIERCNVEFSDIYSI